MTTKLLIANFAKLGLLFDNDGSGEFSLTKDNPKGKKKFWDEEEAGDLVISGELNEEQLEFRCGVIEVGDFSANIDLKEQKTGLTKVVLAQLKDQFVQAMFLHYKEKNNKSTALTAVKTCRPVIYCDNGNVDIKAAMTALSQHFKVVAVTKNPGSKNTITTYISIQ